MRIAVGADHAGYHLKETIKSALFAAGVDVDDVGTTGEASVDYPDYAAAVARRVASGICERGILVCGTGIGMAIAANKVDGIRAALVHDVTGAALSRQHNDANVLVLGGGMLGERLIREIVRTWVNSRFDGGRHQQRIDKIARIESAHGHAADQKPPHERQEKKP